MRCFVTVRMIRRRRFSQTTTLIAQTEKDFKERVRVKAAWVAIFPDPLFVNTYHLRGGSPAIDVGNNSASDLPATDLAGNQRIINGNDGPTAIVDLGTYELVPVTVSTKSLSFGLQSVGSSTTKTVKLTNAQNKVLNISSYSVPTSYTVTGCGSTLAALSTCCSLTVTFQPLTSGTF